MAQGIEVNVAILQDVFDRILSDLAMLSDRPIELLSMTYEDRSDRPAGEHDVHISYRVSILGHGHVDSGVLLVPLPRALALAAYLMMSPDEQVREVVDIAHPTPPIKEAILEIGTFVAAACDAALQNAGVHFDRVAFAGCQGVQADVRPALDYVEGTPLAVGRGFVQVADQGRTEMILALPQAVISGL